MANDIAELFDSTPLIGDPEAVREKFAENGYAFFRNILDPDLVQRGYELFKGALRAEGLIAKGSSDTTWTGGAPKTRRPCDALGMTFWPDVAAQPRLNSVLGEVMGEPPVWVPIVSHRSSLPGSPFPASEGRFAGRHQDGFFNEGIEFVICWIPLMDIDRKNGGLAVSAGSHTRGYLHDSANAPRYPIPDGAIDDDTWVTTDFRAGDVLMFDYRTAHTGLPNQTDLIRVSIDMRAIPLSSPRPVVGSVVRQEGAEVRIRTDDGEEVDVIIGDDTYIREMNPFPKVPVAEVARVATVGRNVIAMVDDAGRATVLRPNFY